MSCNSLFVFFRTWLALVLFYIALITVLALCFARLSFASVPALPALVFEQIIENDNPPANIDTDTLNQDLPPAKTISISDVNRKIYAIENQNKAQQQTTGPQADNTPIFTTFTDLYDTKIKHDTIARLDQLIPTQASSPSDDKQTNLADNHIQIESNPNLAPFTDDNKAGINPNQYLPIKSQINIAPVAIPKRPDDDNKNKKKTAKPALYERIYSRLFNDGVLGTPRLSAKVYLTKNNIPDIKDNNLAQSTTANDTETIEPVSAWQYENPLTSYVSQYSKYELSPASNQEQPFKNIVAALGNITQESVSDFQIALPRLKETVSNAAKAVGYYDIQFYLRNNENGKIDVIITDLGKTVDVVAQVIDIRGAGANFPAFDNSKQKALKIGEVFNQGIYEATKNHINTTQNEHGFFDGRWLNHSADVILPDNVADISLVYDTGEQYTFGDVVFFTLDPKTGTLTDDPDKLPVDLNLLKKMVSFNTDEPFNRNAINQLSNQLSATRYFNTANVEVIYPNRQSDNHGISFTQEQNTDNQDNLAQVNDQEITNNPSINGMTTPTNQSTTILPIDFHSSQIMQEKLGLVTAKAERLLASPDNRILDENKKITDSLLGQLSHAISHFANKILPDEKDDGLTTLPAGTKPPALANKKTPQMVYQEKKIPLYVFVMSDKPKDTQLGVGWGSDTGSRLTARLENYLLNRQGMQWGADVSLSGRMRGINLFFSRPLSHPVNNKLSANLKYLEQKINQGASGFDLSAKTLEQSLAHTIIKKNDWHKVYSLRYRLDALDTKAPKETWQDLPVRFVASRENQEVVLAGIALSKVVQNTLASPTWGYRQYYSIEVGSHALKSDTDLAILRAGLGGMTSFGDNIWGNQRAHQLIGKLDLGYIWAKDFNLVPYKLRFFAGGDNSLRGYDYESLAPVSPSGYLLGGQALVIGSIEYNYEFLQNIRTAVFADIGNAYDKNLNNDTKIGLGVGVRWASPVGVVRFDVAKGVNDDIKQTPVRLHFLIGLPF